MIDYCYLFAVLLLLFSCIGSSVTPQGYIQQYDHNERTTEGTFGMNISILLIVRAISVSGGDISILQEVLYMRSRGINVAIAVPAESHPEKLTEFIHSVGNFSSTTYNDMILTYSGKCCFPNTPSEELIRLASSYDVVVATLFTTVSAVQHIASRHSHILPAYYVQDYEPWFLCSPYQCLTTIRKFSDYWTPRERSRRRSVEFCRTTYTYGVSGQAGIPMHMFAKTNWLVSMVRDMHGTHVHKVAPSIDHSVFHPPSQYAHPPHDPHEVRGWEEVQVTPIHTSPNNPAAAVKVVAMIRPRTPRRNALHCLDVMLRLARYSFNQHSHTHTSFLPIHVTLFGAPVEDIRSLVSSLRHTLGPADHRNVSVLDAHNVFVLGVVRERQRLADLFRQSDIFLDMSWWQAFGRTGVEAMACGCLAIMPSIGAAPEICESPHSDLASCLYHDGNDIDGVFTKVLGLAQNHTLRMDIARRGIRRAFGFTLEQSTQSIVTSLHEGLLLHRQRVPTFQGNNMMWSRENAKWCIVISSGLVLFILVRIWGKGRFSMKRQA